MTAHRRTVLLTGATGNWGRVTLQLFRERADIRVRALAVPTRADKAVLEDFRDMENLDVIWGDLTRYADVHDAVIGVDVILHVGAVVSPLPTPTPLSPGA